MYTEQLAFFDDEEYSEILSVLKRGTCFEGGKERIIEYYQTHGITGLETMLKDEYGIGGYCNGEVDMVHDGKGIKITYRKNGEGERKCVALTWLEAAKKIAALIETGNY